MQWELREHVVWELREHVALNITQSCKPSISHLSLHHCHNVLLNYLTPPVTFPSVAVGTLPHAKPISSPGNFWTNFKLHPYTENSPRTFKMLSVGCFYIK